MFVRSRPSRTRAERPIPGDRVLDAFDRALIGAHGAALALVAVYLSRAGIVEADEFGRCNPRRDGRRSESLLSGPWHEMSNGLLSLEHIQQRDK